MRAETTHNAANRIPRDREAYTWTPRQRDVCTVSVGFEQMFGFEPSLLKISTWLNCAPLETVLAAVERVSTRIRNGNDFYPEHEVWKIVRRYAQN
jgi:hypothetical protein